MERIQKNAFLFRDIKIIMLNPKKRKVNILETTLRDGSYAVNFSFTQKDTSILCKKLEDVGIEFIEIGHGVGLSAQNKGFGQAMATDEEYMFAAKSVLSKSKYGMFCIPGIARLEDLELASKHNMSFIRIGTNVTEIPMAEYYIKKAKDLGMFVCANFMKSYALPPEKFAEKVLLAESYGADLVYLVDSAGGMFNQNIHSYYSAIRKVSKIRLGFHGHNNLDMAISNSIAAADIGFDFIDASLQGLGRSSGNASTENLMLALLKNGYHLEIDLLKLLEIGQQYIHPLIPFKGRRILDSVSGFSDFHSSYMNLIHKYSSKFNINPAILILELCKKDKVNVSDDLVQSVAQNISVSDSFFSGKYDFNTYYGKEQ